MDNEKIQNYLLSNGKYLPLSEIDLLASKMQLIEDEILIFRIFSVSFKNPTTFTLLYWLCPGFSFIDRLFIRLILSGILKTIFMPLVILILIIDFSTTTIIPSLFGTIGGSIIVLLIVGLYLIWIIIDGFTINRRVRNYNLTQINRLIGNLI